MRLKLGAEWQCCCMILQRFYTSLQSGNQRFSLRPFSMRKFNAILIRSDGCTGEFNQYSRHEPTG